jgi:protein-tyrosine phosphatase
LLIDLHCHLLPGVDDGAKDPATALAMARIAVGDGIGTIACTPHIYPGLYENEGARIRAAVTALQATLRAADIDLALASGADAHLTPELLARVKSGSAPRLNGGRYFLLEPPHHLAPPRFEESVFAFLLEGFVPILTHPERLGWIERHYDAFTRCARRGAWIQVTAGSLTGRFGSRPRYWSERLLDEGFVHVLATDAHGVEGRPPLLAEGRDAARKWVGPDEAERLVVQRPRAVLDDVLPAAVPAVPALCGRAPVERRGWLDRLWRRPARVERAC